MATKQNLAFELGETWVIDLDLEGPDGALAAADVADVQFRLVQDGEIAIDLTMAAGVTVSGTDAAAARIKVSPGHQAGVIAQLQSYEARAILVDGGIHTQAYGALNVRASLFASLGHAPSMVFMEPNLCAALSGPGSWIGDLFALDPDGDTGFAWALVDSLSNRFAISGENLVVGSAGLALADVGHTLEPIVRVTDPDGNATEATVAVVVTKAAMLSGDLAGDAALMSSLGIY